MPAPGPAESRPSSPETAGSAPLALPRGVGKTVIIAARYGDWSGDVAEWLKALGGHAMVVGERLLPLEWIDQYAGDFDLALIDADHIGDPGDVVDLGLRLRRYAPGLPLVFVSSRVSQDDLGTDRAAICDATLRKPLTRRAFLRALPVALDNHARWIGARGDSRFVPPRRKRGAT